MVRSTKENLGRQRGRGAQELTKRQEAEKKVSGGKGSTSGKEGVEGREVDSSALGCPEGYGCTRWAGAGLTIIVNEEGGVGCEDLVVADLAVLGGAVTVNGFHPQDAVIQLPLSHCSSVQPLHKHGGKLIHIIDTHMNSRPACARAGGGERTSQPSSYWRLQRGTSRNPDRESAGGRQSVPWLGAVRHLEGEGPQGSCTKERYLL